jgi:hypothetical protein
VQAGIIYAGKRDIARPMTTMAMTVAMMMMMKNSYDGYIR